MYRHNSWHFYRRKKRKKEGGDQDVRVDYDRKERKERGEGKHANKKVRRNLPVEWCAGKKGGREAGTRFTEQEKKG